MSNGKDDGHSPAISWMVRLKDSFLNFTNQGLGYWIITGILVFLSSLAGNYVRDLVFPEQAIEEKVRKQIEFVRPLLVFIGNPNNPYQHEAAKTLIDFLVTNDQLKGDLGKKIQASYAGLSDKTTKDKTSNVPVDALPTAVPPLGSLTSEEKKLLPRIYIHYVRNADKQAIETALPNFAKESFIVPPIERIEADKAPKLAEVRYFSATADELAEAKKISRMLGISKPPRYLYIRDLKIRPRYYEVWFGRDD